MKNIERQKSLDKKKWLESQKVSEDMTGLMFYCDYCVHKTSRNSYKRKCDTTQEQRERDCLCAKAYNRLQRSKPQCKE